MVHHVLRFASGYLYYGAVLLTATVLQYDPHCGINTTINDTQCVELDNGFYAKLVWTTLAEFPGKPHSSVLSVAFYSSSVVQVSLELYWSLTSLEGSGLWPLSSWAQGYSMAFYLCAVESEQTHLLLTPPSFTPHFHSLE